MKSRILIAGMILSLSFSCAQQASQPTFCPLSVHPDGCTREWLEAQRAPQCVNDYLHKIGIQQKDIDDKCK